MAGSSSASTIASSATKVASKSASKASKIASSSALSASKAAKSAAASASANAEATLKSTSSTTYTILTTVIALLLVAGGYLYLSGQGQDIAQWMAKQYFKAEAKAEQEALATKGITAGQDFMKERLKKNPVVGNDELNEVSEGLGDEAQEGLGKIF